MTVSGEASGDADGVAAPSPPATIQMEGDGCSSPERALCGRFWVLQSSDDEDEGETRRSTSDGENKAVSYLSLTPRS
jgi:hypothetical protein